VTGDSSFKNANIKHDTKYGQIILFQKSKYLFFKKNLMHPMGQIIETILIFR